MKTTPYNKFCLIFPLFIFFTFQTDSFSFQRSLCGSDAAVLGGDEGWRLVKDKDGIRVYVRKTPVSDIPAFRGVTTVETDFKRVVALIWDAEKYPQWVMLIDAAECLKEVSPTENYYHFVSKLIWPVKDRDRISHRKIYQDSVTGVVILESCSEPYFIPEKKEYIRFPFTGIYAKITPVAHGKVEIVYEAVVDMGGAIPEKITGYYIDNVAYLTLKRIRNKLLTDDNENTKLEWLTVPEASAGQIKENRRILR